MSHRDILLCWLVVALWLLPACSPDNPPPLGPNLPSPEASGEQPVEIEAAREGVFTVQDGQRQTLPAVSEQATLVETGEGIAVDEGGRAILNFADLLTVELLQGGELQLQQFAVDEQTAAITLLQNGGTLIADLTLQQATDLNLTVQTEFATVTAGSGTRFALVREANSPLEWVVGLEAGEGGALQITAGDVTQSIVGGQARWISPIGELGPVAAVSRNIEAWLQGARNSVAQPGISEILWAPANILADTGTLTTLPGPGQPFELGQGVQGAVSLTLDPQGIFGNPIYTLEDCDGDGVQDIAMRNGLLTIDFRQVLGRVMALSLSVFNRDQPGQGSLQGLDPAGVEISRQQVEVGPDEFQTLSLGANQPYHYAELVVSDACFLGLSLTPPDSSGQPVETRPVTEDLQRDVVVNVLATSAERLPQNGQFQAPSVGPDGDGGLLEIDGAQDDWDSLARQSGIDWTSFSVVTHDDGCANRYPGADNLTDLTSRVQFAYDEQYLYVAFVVNDDGLVTYTGEDERYFLGDSPQLLLDLDLNGDFEDSKLSADDVQVDLNPGGDSPRAALWQLGSLTSRPLATTLVAVTPTDTGYFLEAALPWQDMNVTPQPGDRLGIVASVNDNDTPETNTQECIISTSPQRDWRNPITWGTLLLKPGSQ